MKRSDLPGALQSYKEGLDIARKLAAADRTSADAQRDMLISLVKLAAVPNSGTSITDAKTQLDLMRARKLVAPEDEEIFAAIDQAAAQEAGAAPQ